MVTTNYVTCILVLIRAWHVIPPGWEMEMPMEHPDALLQWRRGLEDPVLLVNAGRLFPAQKSYFFLYLLLSRVLNTPMDRS